jgi:hypothetical protein
MRDYFDLYQLPVPQAGESYRSLFDSLTKPWGDRLVTVEGNARAAEPGTESIALLVIDLVYFWEQGADILQRFLPLLREPGSLLVGREFLNPTIGLLPALLVGVRDRLRVRSKFGDTVWFEVVEPMPESITWPTFLWELPNESVESAVSWCASIAPERGDRWPLLVRGALEMMSERFDSAADVLQQIYASPVRDDAYLRRMVDRFVEKLLYRLEWDAAVREEMGWAEPPLQERAGSPREAIWQSFLRFKAWRMGEACEPIHYTVGSEDSTEENRIALAWREVMALARGIDWPGNTWVRLADA